MLWIYRNENFTLTTWPDEFRDLVMMPRMADHLQDLADLVESEDWEYQNSQSEYERPILSNYLRYTYKRLAEEDKIVLAEDGQAIAFNTGLVTEAQEPVFCFCVTNRLDNVDAPWHFNSWRRRGEHELTRFSYLPEMANYYSDPATLVFDTSKELRTNVEHIIEENKGRFPAPYSTMDSYTLQTFLKGAVDNAIERVKRNYKTAIPQYYRGSIQLLLPLCIQDPRRADLALVAVNHENFYRASTCLTLDMAYNNARQLARPDRDWLNP